MDYSKLKIAIIGSGRWGMNHVKTALSILNPGQITVMDSDKSKESKIKELDKSINFTSDISSILTDDTISGIIISSPAETHFELAKLLLDHNKNILVEKPITLSLEEAEELVDLAKRKLCRLMVGHVLLYHPAVLKMKEEIDGGRIGNIQYIYSNRLNLGAVRQEENILWSFAPHDISVIQFLVGSNPTKVFAHGATYLQNDIEDTTLTYLEYPGNIKAHIFVSWLNPFKEQRLVVIGDQGMFVFEDSLKSEKLKFYEKGFVSRNGIIEKFDNDYVVVDFENSMPLTEEHLHFYDCIIKNINPRTDGKHALDVLKILFEATKQLKEIEL